MSISNISILSSKLKKKTHLEHQLNKNNDKLGKFDEAEKI